MSKGAFGMTGKRSDVPRQEPPKEMRTMLDINASRVL
jgi:hypothetical protein